MVNAEIRLIIFFEAEDGKADCGSDHELLIAKFRLKLKKAGKTTRPFRYDLNKIPYNYTENRELPDVQAGFRKGRGTRNQIANIHWIIKKAREFQKSIYFCFINYAKVFDCVDHKKLWKILKEMGITDHLNCLLRNV